MTHRAAGMLAAAASLAATELLGGLIGLRETPVLAVAQGVVELTPGPVAETIIGLVGTADKPLAVVCVAVAVLALGAVVGGWWVSHRRRALAGVLALVLVAALAVAARPYASVGGMLVCVVGGLVVLGVLHALLHARVDLDVDEARRAVFRTVILVAVATALAGGLGQVFTARRRRRAEVEQARSVIRLPLRGVTEPTGVDLGVDGQGPWRTPTRDFYRIDTVLAAPLIDPADWSLRIHGMDEREVRLSYADLVDRGLRDAWITLCCVSNTVGGSLIGNTVWSGVAMKDLLEEAGVREGADALLSTSEDGWTCSTPLSALLDGRDALLALAMDGKPLPVEHGFPVRQVVPRLYGYVSATKWVVDWEVTRFADVEAYWTTRGWAVEGPVKTQSRIDVPRGDVHPGTVVVAGVAWAQQRGIRGVEVRVDEGPWHQATLASAPNDDTWVQWTWKWEADPGRHSLQVRATDGAGEPQTGRRADPVPDGASGYHEVGITVG